jgi:hypothetical protein
MAKPYRTKQIQNNAKKGGVMYQNPTNPEQTWSGRGMQPSWMNDLLRAGMDRENLLLAATKTNSTYLDKIDKVLRDTRIIDAAQLAEERIIQKDEDKSLDYSKSIDKNLVNISKIMAKGFADLTKVIKGSQSKTKSLPLSVYDKPEASDIGESLKTRTFDTIGEKIAKKKQDIAKSFTKVEKGGTLSLSNVLNAMGLVQKGSGGVISNILEKREDRGKFIREQKLLGNIKTDAELKKDYAENQKIAKAIKRNDAKLQEYRDLGLSDEQISSIKDKQGVAGIGKLLLEDQQDLAERQSKLGIKSASSMEAQVEQGKKQTPIFTTDKQPVAEVINNTTHEAQVEQGKKQTPIFTTDKQPVAEVINNTTHEAQVEQGKKQDETIVLLRKIEENTRSFKVETKTDKSSTEKEEKGGFFDTITDAITDLSPFDRGGKSKGKSPKSGKWGGSKMTDVMSGKKSLGARLKGGLSSIAERGKGLIEAFSGSTKGKIISNAGTVIVDKGIEIAERASSTAGKVIGKASPILEGATGVLSKTASSVGGVATKALSGIARVAGPAGMALTAGEIAHEGAKAFAESFGEGGFDLIQKLRKEDAISYGLGFTPHVDDWSKIEKLPTSDIKTLIATNEFEGKDLERLKILESGGLSPVSKPETSGTDYIIKPNREEANAVYDKSSTIEATKEDMKMSGGNGNTIVSAPTVNNQTIQNQTVRLSTRNNDDTTRRYVSSRFANA